MINIKDLLKLELVENLRYNYKLVSYSVRPKRFIEVNGGEAKKNPSKKPKRDQSRDTKTITDALRSFGPAKFGFGTVSNSPRNKSVVFSPSPLH